MNGMPFGIEKNLNGLKFYNSVGARPTSHS